MSQHAPSLILAYCRAGFEAECAHELEREAAALGCRASARIEPGSARVLLEPEAGSRPRIRLDALVFARQLVFDVVRLESGLGDPDAPRAVAAIARRLSPQASELWVETPDTDEAKRALQEGERLARAARSLLGTPAGGGRRERPRVHVCADADGRLFAGLTHPGNRSPHFMGIPRLAMPPGAPSRSALKLVEAIEVFLGEDEALRRLRAGRAAVDLGAAPGGWSHVLAARGLRVYAVDNGPIAPSLLADGLVEHVRADAFRFRPEYPVDWMVCDVVAAPQRIAALVAGWLARGWCRETIFNLKLPGERRLDTIDGCRATMARVLATAGIRHELRLRQLYHDRQEVTGHARALDGATPSGTRAGGAGGRQPSPGAGTQGRRGTRAPHAPAGRRGRSRRR